MHLMKSEIIEKIREIETKDNIIAEDNRGNTNKQIVYTTHTGIIKVYKNKELVYCGKNLDDAKDKYNYL